jgi:hypothetical protein
MATDSMTVKITPNDRGNQLTSTDHRRFSDQEIAQAATPSTSTESLALKHPAFERHYRIGELAEMWQLGRETVRVLVKDERGVIKFALDARRRTRSTPCRNRWPFESTRACSTAANGGRPQDVERRPRLAAPAVHQISSALLGARLRSLSSGYLRPPDIPTSFGFSL